MTWLLVALLTLAAFFVTRRLMKPPRSGAAAIGAALLAGIAGYAAQSHPSLPGSPTAARERIGGDAEGIAARQKISDQGPEADKRMIIADAMARNGRYADAATILRGVVTDHPKDATGWLALANTLVSHADGRLSPAAVFAFRRAEEAQPENPGPPFFFGMALAQSGRLKEARAVWADLLGRSPADAPWRGDLTARLQELDAFVAQQAARGARQP